MRMIYLHKSHTKYFRLDSSGRGRVKWANEVVYGCEEGRDVYG